jgi:hypothetical protein
MEGDPPRSPRSGARRNRPGGAPYPQNRDRRFARGSRPLRNDRRIRTAHFIGYASCRSAARRNGGRSLRQPTLRRYVRERSRFSRDFGGCGPSVKGRGLGDLSLSVIVVSRQTLARTWFCQPPLRHLIIVRLTQEHLRDTQIILHSSLIFSGLKALLAPYAMGVFKFPLHPQASF